MFRTLLAIGVFTAIAFAAPSSGGTTSEPQPQKSETTAYEVKVTPEMRRHSRIEDTLYFADTAYGFAVLLFVLATGLSRRMRALAARVSRKKFVVALVYSGLFIAVTTLLQFPLDYYGGFVVQHQFDLSDQSFASWMGDLAKGFGVSIVIGSTLMALALLAIRRFARWWIAVWIGTVAVALIGMIVAPVLLDPIFNKFEPLRDVTLRQALLDEASRAGIEGSRVYQVNKSKQTKTMNAYFTGIGPTKRIVLWDTLLEKLSHDEIVAVMGHEMGHYVLNHLWKGLGWTALIALVVALLAQQSYERGLSRWGRRWGVESKDDPAALPWLLILVSAITFLLSPVISGISRHAEHQADVFGLELTHLNDPMAKAFVKFAEDSKVDPTPNRFIEFWRYSHPSLTRRIEFVRNYKPWEHGQPNEYWKGTR